VRHHGGELQRDDMCWRQHVRHHGGELQRDAVTSLFFVETYSSWEIQVVRGGIILKSIVNKWRGTRWVDYRGSLCKV